ncbi:hypothetical protein TW86_03635 [Halomonas sp. S2151]|uniref:hypothetical protein n=1 Tax=Halomonas sp. S2151 TaxID=579478 RepID=UPI00061DFD2B|nr:hypothetical protein [Halomonas sp. S2151]KJZ17361.1 hypothetical protein TW86_03635 [Halomonas sp. S2151]
MTVNLKRSRWVKRTETGRFTIETAAEKKREVLLCDTCGINDQCPVKAMMDKADHFVTLSVRNCDKYIPCVGFMPPMVGLERQFNTLRVGKGWYERLEVGDRVALVNTKSSEIEGYAEVKHLYHGAYREMIDKHAIYNHTAFERGPGQSAQDYVDGVLKKANGHFLSENSTLTAIYLRRLENGIRIRSKEEAGAGQER